MKMLDYSELVTSKTLAEARSTYDALHERVYKLVTIIVGGAGGAAIYALGKWEAPDSRLQVIALLTLSCWWFAIAAYLLLKGASSRELTPGSDFGGLAEHFERHLQTVNGEDVEGQAVDLTRWDDLAAVDKLINSYCKGGIARATALDRAYIALVATVLVVAFALLLAWRFM